MDTPSKCDGVPPLHASGRSWNMLQSSNTDKHHNCLLLLNYWIECQI
jgi:hypothetical protein